MAIHVEAQPFAASPTFKVGETLKVSPFVTQVKVQSIPKEQRLASAVDTISTMASGKAEPLKNEPPKNETSVEKALRQLDTSYTALKESVNLKKFDSAKIEDYFRLAEKRSGFPIPEADKAQIRELVKTQDPELLRMVALELRVGISEKAEKEAMAALGRLILYRENTKALQAYLLDPGKDQNLKAHVKTVLMMNRVEGALSSFESVKRKVKKVLLPWQILFPPVASNN